MQDGATPEPHVAPCPGGRGERRPAESRHHL